MQRQLRLVGVQVPEELADQALGLSLQPCRWQEHPDDRLQLLPGQTAEQRGGSAPFFRRPLLVACLRLFNARTVACAVQELHADQVRQLLIELRYAKGALVRVRVKQLTFEAEEDES